MKDSFEAMQLSHFGKCLVPVGTCSPCVESGVGAMGAGLCVHGEGCTCPFLEGRWQ